MAEVQGGCDERFGAVRHVLPDARNVSVALVEHTRPWTPDDVEALTWVATAMLVTFCY